jgi:hypothetical protein
VTGPSTQLATIVVYVPGVGAELAEGINWVNSLPGSDPARHDCEAFIYMTLARSAWRRADELRAAQRGRPARAARRGGRGPG